MRRFYEFITEAANLVGVICLGSMTLVTLVAVFWRYLLNSALPWPEEATRYFFIIATYMGISVVMGSDGHLKMEVLATLCGKAAERSLRVVYLIITLGFFGYLVRLSYDMTMKIFTLEQTAIAFPFPLWIVWAGMFLAFILTALQAARQLMLALLPNLFRSAGRS